MLWRKILSLFLVIFKIWNSKITELPLNGEKILVTAALPYANGKIHLGHLGGAYLPADIFVRYKRLTGADVLFVCGSDEHGVPITITADKEGVKPKVIIDRFHNANKEAFEKLGMDFDIYSRTSTEKHHQVAKEFFLEYHKNGLLSERKTMQFFDDKAGMFLPDRYVEGVCPNCGYESARSDECENCGALYDPNTLINPVSKITGQRPVLKETSHWYFPLEKFQERLESYIKEADEKYGWKENVLQYCRGWLKGGLRERAYTRDLDWGVAVPLENSHGKVLYVWFEAVLGYISATMQLSEERGTPDLWKEFWQNPDTKYTAFIGKDNVVFHTIIFPAMLMAWNDCHADKYILPTNVPANEFLNYESKKFSKSRGWGVELEEFLADFDPDSLRYALALSLPEARDTDFLWKDFQARHNNELSDILGNLVNRTLTFIHKNFEGKLPEPGQLNERDSEILALAAAYPAKIAELIERYRLKDATLEMMNLARATNKYFNDSEPWKTVKSDKTACGTTLYISSKLILTIAEIFSPVIPVITKRIFEFYSAKPVAWSVCGDFPLRGGLELKTPEILFKKIEDSQLEKYLSQLTPKEAAPSQPEDQEITIDDFSKVKLRTAKVLEAENVPKSEKLLKLQVEVGGVKRQIVSGIAKYYKPEELIGRMVVIVANLKPAKLMGLESRGMILAVETEEGKLDVVETAKNVKSGTIVK
ncbi:MAG: methionine--tRNA ligase [Ignavibacteriaceae bacterium]|nr:methionine--tRNA ligase [Ignavibacteriaceae bacterium]